MMSSKRFTGRNLSLVTGLIYFVVSGFFFAASAEQIEQKYITSEKIRAVENYIKQGMEKLGVPGLSVALLEAGRPVLLKGYGIANEKGAQVTKKTSFDLGSISKSFTAMVIMQLQQENKINVESPVVKYIPWFKSKDKARSDKILVKQLLSHQSGLSTISGNRNLDGDDNSAVALKKSVTELSNIALVSEPGERYEYSNANYHLLGYLIELLEGESYE